MDHYFKILKKLIALLLIVPFFSFGEVAYAQSTTDETNISNCVTQAIQEGIAASATRLGVQEAGALLGASFGGTKPVVATALSVPVADATANITLGATQGLINVSNSFQDVLKMDLDAAAYSVAQCTLSQITDNTVKWIQGGFNGSPAFAVNVNQLFGDITTGVLENFSNQIKNLEACDFTINFKYDLADSVQLSTPKNKFPAQIKCPFSPQTVTASQFYNDRSSFSWKLMETALSDRGNRFGVSAITAQEAERRQQEAKTKADQKLSWSNGFADVLETDPSKCNYPADIYDSYTGWTSKSNPASGDYIGDAAMKFIQNESCPTTTPGKMIGDTLMKAIGAKQDRLGFADNMNKIISALIGELTKEATKDFFKAVQ